jgi:acetate kinase
VKLLVLNAGSSSVKFRLYEMAGERLLASGLIERIAEETSHAVLEAGEARHESHRRIPDHRAALAEMRSLLRESGVLPDFDILGGIGHRVVHGGEDFGGPTLVTDDVVDRIEALCPLAPLHNPANLLGIRAMRHLAPDVPQIAVFDTAFHHSLPPEASRYALPKHLYERYGIRRYGFHGTSPAFVAAEAARRLGKPPESLHLITLHLGNGASACAVRGGRSVETSMGLTPLEGLVMGTRSGDVDPGVLTFLGREAQMTNGEIDTLLNRESGLRGLAGTNDMREIEAARAAGDPDACLAFDIFVHRLRKYVGAYAVVLGRLDALVFTGGIGEHSAAVREAVCDGLGILGIRCDTAANRTLGPDGGTFHAEGSTAVLMAVPTNEELSIARQALPFCESGTLG